MNIKDTKETVARSIFFRVFLANMIVLALLFLWQIFFEVESATETLRVVVILMASFLFLTLYVFLSIRFYIGKSLIDPLLQIKAADQGSDIDQVMVKPVKFDDIVFTDIQGIADFRNSLASQLEERERRSRLKTPLDEIHHEISRLTDGVVQALAQANLYNDDDTGEHMDRLGAYSRLLAQKAGLPEEFIVDIERFAPLHDVGKIGMPDDILKKPGRLNPEEWAVMKTHSKIGYDILKSVGLSTIAQNIALFHHERWTGTGYPEGLKGEEIPIEARIVAIADVFDALVNERVYKPAFPRDKVEKIMFSEIGRHFDPQLGKVAFENLDGLYEILKGNTDES